MQNGETKVQYSCDASMNVASQPSLSWVIRRPGELCNKLGTEEPLIPILSTTAAKSEEAHQHTKTQIVWKVGRPTVRAKTRRRMQFDDIKE